MAEKDLRPTRYLLTLRYTTAFIKQFFEQNPISQLGIIGLKDGLAHLLSPLSGNPADHITALQKLRLEEPLGNPSLQNALEMARAQLFHAPSHGTREALIISGALLSSDPGDIHVTIAAVANDHIRVSAIGLAAQVAILEEMCKKTGGEYSIAMHEEHFRSLYMHFTTPPPTRTKEQSQSSLLMMGFPSRTVTKERSLCACHSKLSRSGYLCSRCGSKVCSLPAECPACGLTLILSTHLARSYHHLFPLRNWREVPWAEAVDSEQAACYACQTTFPLASVDWKAQAAKAKDAVQERKLKAASESSRYACTVCHKHFCIECDLFAHEVVHNCPGCQSDTRPKLQQSQAGGNEMVNGHQNSNGTANGELYGRQS
jgi:transcription initiation factor TFIIH subunit 2